MNSKLIFPLFFLLYLLIHSGSTYSSDDIKVREMKMDSKDMNGMKSEGKDGIMSKAEMKKMNRIMKDCMRVHKDKKLCLKATKK
ncbi:hypothetical protein C0V70_06040 [Bacteriovorax stolpii]|uniref:Uncharacterized protein n=1 Tax=Bacteriovorax stolpii TaxID=960 RepID=A0A2K9NQ90_BACTC|nr:hypothetical protein [Bacteriovorax stolpii]AUN97678.1 hypothetical protein C0V70_06040 [Bacteriovorax stolpii]TDP51497.1 hypothetical protein C8D79_2941 [Bacteriovorax stolpii]